MPFAADIGPLLGDITEFDVHEEARCGKFGGVDASDGFGELVLLCFGQGYDGSDVVFGHVGGWRALEVW